MLIASFFHILIPFFSSDQILSRDPDTYYSVRQIEVMTNNFYQYNWYDPFTSYPKGRTVDWGPLFAIFASSLCMLFGAHTFLQIYSISSLASPILSIFIIPIVYLLGKEIFDSKAGLIASGLMTVISFQYFIVSSYTGWIDHHIMEVFFTTLFFLTYLYSLRKHFLFSVLSGVILFLALITSTTTIICLVIILFYIILISFTENNNTLVSTTIPFVVSIFLLFIFGFVREPGFSLIQYSIGVIYVQIAIVIIAITVFLFSKITKLYPRLLWGIPLGVAGICALIIEICPPVRAIADQSISLIFGNSQYTSVVTETSNWSIIGMWSSFNMSIILMICGIFILIYYRNNKTIFLLIWLSLMLFLTILHQRFQYYLTIPLAITTGICISDSLNWKVQWGKWLIILLTVGCVAVSAYNDVNYVVNNDDRLSNDWVLTMEWIQENTEDTGINYYGDYTDFNYPNQSYSVIAMWDYGHWITTLGHRIPVANPFQDGVVETTSFFFSRNESEANEIIKRVNGKYVIVDDNMLNLMGSMAPWIGDTTVNYNDTMAYKLYYSSVGNYTLVHQEGGIKIFEYGRFRYSPSRKF